MEHYKEVKEDVIDFSLETPEGIDPSDDGDDGAPCGEADRVQAVLVPYDQGSLDYAFWKDMEDHGAG